MGGEVLVLLWYVSALAIYSDGHEGEVALHAPSRRKVNFEPKTVTAGGAGHPAEGRRFTGRHSGVSVQRNLKGNSSRGGAEGGSRCTVSLMSKQSASRLQVSECNLLLLGSCRG